MRLEDEPLGPDEVAAALRLRISYTPDDLFVPEWSAALLIDRECEETLQAIAVANVQLLEYRHLDDRLDDRLARAYNLIYPLAHALAPVLAQPGRQLRELGELRMEAHDLYERTGNVLKLVGDPVPGPRLPFALDRVSPGRVAAQHRPRLGSGRERLPGRLRPGRDLPHGNAGMDRHRPDLFRSHHGAAALSPGRLFL